MVLGHRRRGANRPVRRQVDAASSGSATAAAAATVYVVQGLPAKSISVAIDGNSWPPTWPPPRSSDRSRSVPERTRSPSPTPAGKVVATNTVRTAAGSNSDLVLHLQTAASKKPMVTQFPNTITGIPANKASVTVAHTAAVPPADIRVDGKVLFANVANGESLDVVVPAGTYRVDIVKAGETAPAVFGPVDLTVQGGTLTKVYAVGDPASQDDERGRARDRHAAQRFRCSPSSSTPAPAATAVFLQFFALLTRLWRG